jgi:hypothetical protein
MRRQALLLPLALLVAGCAGGKSGGTERTYPFAETVRCFRAADLLVHDLKTSPTPPEIPHSVQIVDRAKGKTLYLLLFIKSVALAKEHEAHAPSRTPLPGVKSSTERRGNVIVLRFTGGPLGSPSKSVGRKLLDRCLPED